MRFDENKIDILNSKGIAKFRRVIVSDGNDSVTDEKIRETKKVDRGHDPKVL